MRVFAWLMPALMGRKPGLVTQSFSMNSYLCLLLGLCLGLPLFAQQDSVVQTFPPEELDKLVSPIALYPDSLIALILPSSTTSLDIELAAQYLAENGDPSAIDYQPWSDSVKSLAHYPVVVKWMADNLAWTRQMGDVFEAQPADVMAAIQRMRAQARAAGLLTDTPQQTVVMQDEEITIEPAQPDVIYVPVYDPEILWMRRPYYGTYLSFGVGFGVGNWLFYDCDWHERGIWMQHRSPDWVYRPGWRRPMGEAHEGMGEHWRPDPRRVHPDRPMRHAAPVAVRPRIMEDPHREVHFNRPDHPAFHNDDRPGHNDDRSGRGGVPPQDRSATRPAQQVVTPPSQEGRPRQVVGPQALPPSRQYRTEDPRPDHPAVHNDDRSGRVGVPPQERSVTKPTQQVVTPPPRQAVVPQSQPPREHRTDDRRYYSPQTPRPPSHTPVTPSAPQPQARFQRSNDVGPSHGTAPATGRATQPSPKPKSSDKDRDDKK